LTGLTLRNVGYKTFHVQVDLAQKYYLQKASLPSPKAKWWTSCGTSLIVLALQTISHGGKSGGKCGRQVLVGAKAGEEGLRRE
tara:strand:+ start:2803 stop:3051 length:249 start_codon:yes stop_codon:yes gene_type:complete